MKLIQYPNPDISKQERTTLTSSLSPTNTVCPVVNNADFAVADYVVIDAIASDITELRQIATAGVPIPTQIILSTGVSLVHSSGARITKTPFNQARLYRSLDNVTYTLVTTQPLDFQDPYNLINFTDNTGSDAYYYKVEYWNSTLSIGIMSSPIKTETIYGWITIQDFKAETGIKSDDAQVASALKYGAQMISRRIFTPRMYKTTLTGTSFNVPTDPSEDVNNDPFHMEYADRNIDGQISPLDFTIYEVDTAGVRTYVNSDVSSIDVDRHIINFTSQHPAPNKTLTFEYQITFRKLNELDAILRRLNTLYGVNFLFRNIPFKRLQRGIGGWTINNVTVDFQANMISDVIKSNDEEIKKLIASISKLYTRFTPIRMKQPVGISWIKSTLTWTSDNVPG